MKYKGNSMIELRLSNPVKATKQTSSKHYILKALLFGYEDTTIRKELLAVAKKDCPVVIKYVTDQKHEEPRVFHITKHMVNDILDEEAAENDLR